MKIFLFSLLFFQNCLGYLAHLGQEQWNQLRKREKISEYLQSHSGTPQEKEALALVQELKDFGVSELGLSPDSGFVYYVKLDRQEVGWNVSASEPLAFRSYTWWFPIAGTVPYKGFFDREKAEQEEAILKQKGLDTRIRVTGGYSTLGWLSDPIFSPQLEWHKPDLAGLVFHEMAHATVYLSGDSVFNESYAGFVEKKGVEKFYKTSDHPDYRDYLNRKKQRQESLVIIRETASQLQSLYDSEASETEKFERKSQIIEDFKSSLIGRGLVQPNQIERFQSHNWNNEDFIGVLRYKSGEKYFQAKFLEAQEDFSKFHKLVAQDYQKLSPSERKKAMEE